MHNARTNLLFAVDDEKDFLDLVAHLAHGIGYQVITADSAETFREQLVHHRPSLVLLDLQLPGMDGIEGLRHLARLQLNAGVVLASGMDQRVLTSARQLGEALGLKMLGTLQKPAMLEDIEAVLKRHFGQAANLRSEDLRRAIEEVELTVHYQPRLERHSAQWRVGGAEAYVRWQHPQLGLLLPSEFLHLAEDHAMTTAIADFVLTDAIRQVGHWRAHGLNLGVSVNLAPRLVKDLEFPDRLSRILQEFNVAASQLTLDVVEEAAQHDAELAMDIYARLRVKGVGLALDDFGIGASSLTHLYKMPFSELKIDQSLIGALPQNRTAAMVTSAIVKLAHGLSLAVCAEGVESALAFDFLDECGCDRAQGDFIGKAVPASEFEAFILAWNGVHNPPKAAVG